MKNISLTQSQSPLTNYTLRLLQVSRLGNDLRPSNLLVRFELVLVGGTRVPCEPTPLNQLYQLDFTTLDYRCRNLSQDTAAIRQWLRRTIQQQVDQLSPDTGVYFSTTGWHMMDGRHVYLAGSSLIGQNGFLPVHAYTVNAKLEGLSLATAPNLSNTELLSHLHRLVTLDEPVSASLTAYTLLACCAHSLRRPDGSVSSWPTWSARHRPKRPRWPGSLPPSIIGTLPQHSPTTSPCCLPTPPSLMRLAPTGTVSAWLTTCIGAVLVRRKNYK